MRPCTSSSPLTGRRSRTAERVLATFPFDGPPRLTIATVCPAADLHAISSDVTSPVTEMLDRCRTDAAKLLVDAADRCKAWTPKIDRLLLDGHPAEELLKAIDRLYPDAWWSVRGPRGRQADAPRQCLGRIVKHRLTQMLGGDPHEFQPTSDHEVEDPAGTIRQSLARLRRRKSYLPAGRMHFDPTDQVVCSERSSSATLRHGRCLSG